ncbi:MAG: glycoside hydrolase family 3 C-terminal domain-containing protein [Clostridia bacterium]|nr:glycoside hydrolase family 3 C-terminal domain-containing protein [Clostridia bacterium]
MTKAKEKKPVTKNGFTVFTAILAVVMAICLALAIVAPVLTTSQYDDVLRQFFGEAAGKVNGEGYEKVTDGYDTQYVKSDYNSEAEVQAAAKDYFRSAAGEGYVLLKNDTDNGKGLPIATSSSSPVTLDLYSQSSVDFIIGGTGSGTSDASSTLKDGFESVGYKVNEDLWNFYKRSGYQRDGGALVYGQAEAWGINEVPLNELESKVGTVQSIAQKGGTAVFIMARTGGEGRDEAREMADWTDIEEDKSKSYLEPDSVELNIINELNTYYDNIILVLNTNNVMETRWVDNYENIKSVIWVPGGGDQAVYALADLFCGNATPSGHLVDTMAYSDMSSPAMVNFGDIAYVDSNGKETGYYGLSYDEGIYVGYKYYETRYYDSIANSNSTTDFKAVSTAGVYGTESDGKWDYDYEVDYAFGYGMSYTSFSWSDFSVTPGNSGTVTADDTLTVSVTVTNDGDYAGKDVVEVYASAPYTQFDMDNYIEKPAVTLVGYAKTDTLYPASEANDTNKPNSQTLTITVNVSDLTSYDDVVYDTYILESGDYYITAATDAHEAVNNVIAAQIKDESVSISDFSKGDSSLVYTYNPTLPSGSSDGIDPVTFSKSSTGTTITNQFGDTTDSDGNLIANSAEGGTNLTARDKYLTRQDWEGSWPQKNATQSTNHSAFSEVGGYTWNRTIDSGTLSKLQACGTAEAAGNPVSDDSITSDMAGKLGQSGDLELIDYRGLEYKDCDWFALVSQMPKKDVIKILGASGYTTSRSESINKPRTLDYDGPAGLNEMTTGALLSVAYPAEVNMAATWNIEVSEKMGYFMGEDSLQNGVAGWYGPAMDIHRTPFSGRNFEYYSEDAFMSGSMGRVAVKAAAEKGVYAYVKHYALNDQEDHRADNGVATYANEQTMRENYLKVFQMVCEDNYATVNYLEADGNGGYTAASAQVPAMRAVMSAMNRVGSVWAGGNYALLQAVLRDEWGFNGLVLTDMQVGAYMNAAQEIRAGGDAILINTGNGSSNISLNTNADIYYAKQAMSHVLFAVTNSNAMNGLMHGVSIPSNPFAYYYLVVAAIDVVAAAGFIICAVAISRRRKRYMKEQKG